MVDRRQFYQVQVYIPVGEGYWSFTGPECHSIAEAKRERTVERRCDRDRASLGGKRKYKYRIVRVTETTTWRKVA